LTKREHAVTEVLRVLLSPSYTYTDVRGRILSRDAWLEYGPGRTGAATQIMFADMSIRLVGNVAIITARNGMTDGVLRRAKAQSGGIL
jgi:hypothetical protein